MFQKLKYQFIHSKSYWYYLDSLYLCFKEKNSFETDKFPVASLQSPNQDLICQQRDCTPCLFSGPIFLDRRASVHKALMPETGFVAYIDFFPAEDDVVKIARWQHHLLFKIRKQTKGGSRLCDFVVAMEKITNPWYQMFHNCWLKPKLWS